MGDTAAAWRDALDTETALIAAGFKIIKDKAFEMLHPRGGDGRFINKAGAVRWRDEKGLWQRGGFNRANRDGTVSVRDTSGKLHNIAPSKVFNAPKPRATMSDAKIEQIGGQGGSNPGYLGQDSDTGAKWYVKKLKSPAHTINELAGHRLYELVGAPVPDTRISDDNNTFFSKIEDSIAWGDVDGPDRDAVLSEIRKNFVVDAWLANWDAPVTDNIRVTPEGIPLRVDTGGTMVYRAQGGPKPFTPEVSELKTLRDPSISYAGSKLYKNLTKEEEDDGVKRILASSPDAIRQTVKDAGAPDSLADTLIARRAFIAEHYGFTLPEATPEGKKIMESKTDDQPAPDLSSAIKKTPKGEAAPLAPGSPVWLQNKPQDGKKYQDTWLIQNVTPDQEHVTITSVKGNQKLIVPTKDVEILRMNFASVKAKYATGQQPSNGDAVKLPNGMNGTITQLYPMYASVKTSDGKQKVIEVRKLSMIPPLYPDLSSVLAAGNLHNGNFDSSKQKTHLKAAEAAVYDGRFTRKRFLTKDVIPTQEETQTSTDGGGAGPKGLDPIVAKVHGEYYLLDGHHRVENTTSFEGLLVDFDAMEGWKPSDIGTSTGKRDYFVLSHDTVEDAPEIVLMMTENGCYRQDEGDWLPLDPEEESDNFDEYSVIRIVQDL